MTSITAALGAAIIAAGLWLLAVHSTDPGRLVEASIARVAEEIRR